MRACVFKVEGELFALPVNEVVELCSAVSITPVPRAPSPVLGIIHRRGRIVPVVELSAFTRAPPEISDRCVEAMELLVLESERTLVGLRVEEVVGILEVSPCPVEDRGPPRVAAVSLDLQPVLLGTKDLIERSARIVAEDFDSRPPIPAATGGTEP